MQTCQAAALFLFLFENTRGHLHGLILILTWISNHMPSHVWDEITYPFPNFNGCTFEFGEWVSDFIAHFIMALMTYFCWDLS